MSENQNTQAEKLVQFVRLAEAEKRLVNFHDVCKEQGIIPAGFANEWSLGMNLLQMCLMANRTAIQHDRKVQSFNIAEDMEEDDD